MTPQGYSSSTLGEIFNPARDCPHIVEQIPEAEDGFYWIRLPNGKKHKINFALTLWEVNFALTLWEPHTFSSEAISSLTCFSYSSSLQRRSKSLSTKTLRKRNRVDVL